MVNHHHMALLVTLWSPHPCDASRIDASLGCIRAVDRGVRDTYMSYDMCAPLAARRGRIGTHYSQLVGAR